MTCSRCATSRVNFGLFVTEPVRDYMTTAMRGVYYLTYEDGIVTYISRHGRSLAARMHQQYFSAGALLTGPWHPTLQIVDELILSVVHLPSRCPRSLIVFPGTLHPQEPELRRRKTKGSPRYPLPPIDHLDGSFDTDLGICWFDRKPSYTAYENLQLRIELPRAVAVSINSCCLVGIRYHWYQAVGDPLRLRNSA